MGVKRKTAAFYTTLVLIVLIALVVFWIETGNTGEGAGGIDYDPETYPNDERGIPPDQRGGGGIDYDPETYPDDERGIPPSQRNG